MSTETICETATTLAATELTGKRPRWKIELSEERLGGEREDGTRFELPRSEFLRQAQLLDSLLMPRILTIKNPKHVFKFERQEYGVLEAWVGKGPLLRMALRRRLSWVVPIGLLFILGSLPLPADPLTGLEGAPFNPLSAVLGSFLVLQGILARVRPDRIYFLLDSAWFFILFIDTVVRTASGSAIPPLSAAAIALQVCLILSGLRSWRRFGEMGGPGEGEALL